jgi:Protein of unknown function (DUF2938)
MDTALPLIATGIGATLVMDLGSLARRRFFATPLPNYALVGRWIAHVARGRICHAAIAKSAAARGELAIGWLTHYAVGLVFAALLALVAGPAWFTAPTFAPALAIGIATVLFPFLVMQPAMGAGFAASRAPRPNAARLQSLATHAIFGAGLYLAALLFNVIH